MKKNVFKPEKLNGNDVLEELSENHLLIFYIPKSAKGEIFFEAELRVLTRIEVKTKETTGKLISCQIPNQFIKMCFLYTIVLLRKILSF